VRKEADAQDEYQRQYVERCLASLSLANQAAVRSYVRDKEAIDHNKPASLRNHAVVLLAFDQFLQGTPITKATPEQVRDHLLVIGRGNEPYTEWQHASLIKAYLRVHYRGELPYDLRRVLRRKMPESHPKPVVTVEERDKLLATAERLPFPRDRVRTQALLWVLWDTGMRVGEIVTLRTDSFIAYPDGLGVIRMPLGVRGQKTGPRDVQVRECVKPLQVWLGVHPSPRDPLAPLITNGRGSKRYWPQAVNALLKKLCKDAGMRPINPHLFRHSWATRRTRDKWHPTIVAKSLGWSASSRMHKIYVHLDQSDIIAQLRAEAGIASSNVAAPAVDDAALERRLRAMFRRLLLGDEPMGNVATKHDISATSPKPAPTWTPS
jgi:integrase